jgi:hypothetical protein
MEFGLRYLICFRSFAIVLYVNKLAQQSKSYSIRTGLDVARNCVLYFQKPTLKL